MREECCCDWGYKGWCRPCRGGFEDHDECVVPKPAKED